MPRKISPRSTVILSVRPEIPFVLRDHLSLPLSLLLVLLDPFILINAIHEPTHTPNQFPGQRFSQIMLGWQANLEGFYSHVIKVSIYLVEHLLVPVGVRFQGFPLPHSHGQQRVQRPRNPTASHKMSPKCPSKLFKGVDRAFLQAVKPPHRHRPQARWEQLAHQGFALGVHSHSLVKVAHMLHRIHSSIVHGESWLSKTLKKLSSFDSTRKQ